MQMNPLMMMLLLGDDNAALKSKAEYTILCNAVTGADQVNSSVNHCCECNNQL